MAMPLCVEIMCSTSQPIEWNSWSGAEIVLATISTQVRRDDAEVQRNQKAEKRF